MSVPRLSRKDATMTQLKQARGESRGKDSRWPQSRIRESLIRFVTIHYVTLTCFTIPSSVSQPVSFPRKFVYTIPRIGIFVSCPQFKRGQFISSDRNIVQHVPSPFRYLFFAHLGREFARTDFLLHSTSPKANPRDCKTNRIRRYFKETRFLDSKAKKFRRRRGEV